jgi:hypothetical protein
VRRIVRAEEEELVVPVARRELAGRGVYRDEKALMAWLVRKLTSASTAWMAKRLVMGHPTSMSRASGRVRRVRTLGKRGKDLEKIGSAKNHGLTPETTRRRRRARGDRLAGEMPLEVESEAVGRVVAALAILLEALHHDPVEIAAQRGGKPSGFRMAALRSGREFVTRERLDPRRGPRRINLANDAPDFIQARLGKRRGVDRGASSEQFVEQHAEAVLMRPSNTFMSQLAAYAMCLPKK